MQQFMRDDLYNDNEEEPRSLQSSPLTQKSLKLVKPIKVGSDDLPSTAKKYQHEKSDYTDMQVSPS